MKNRLKYLVWKATGRSKVVRMVYIFLRRYRLRCAAGEREFQANMDSFSGDGKIRDEASIKKEILACMYRYGISMDEYFLFDFRSLSHSQRDSYLTTFNRLHYYQALNDFRYDEGFTNKYATYQHYKQYFKREMVLLTKERTNIREFEDFVEKNPVFVYKPLAESSGRGIAFYDLGKFPSASALYHELTGSAGIVESLIVQDEPLARFNRSSVNTIRIPHVITRDGDTVIFAPRLRVGQDGSIVDNTGSGGILANIDPETGIVYTDGTDTFGKRYRSHPSTNVIFRGFQVPRWEEAVSLVKEMAQVLPTVRYVGWDLALTPEGWVLVEANNEGAFKGLQVAERRGLKHELSALI